MGRTRFIELSAVSGQPSALWAEAFVRRGNIYRLAVDPDYRRQGLAHKLVDEVDIRLASMDVKRITALVEKEHP